MRIRGRAAPHVERADALRPVELVRREREQVDLRAPTSTGTLPTACAASLWKRTPRARQRAPSAAIGCTRADLALRPDHRDERAGSARARRAPRGRRGPSASTGSTRTATPSRASAAALSDTAGCSIAEWISTRRRRAARAQHALQREVVALGGAAREDDLARLGRADRRRDLLARLLDRGLRAPAVHVRAARRVAELVAQPRLHRREDARIDRRRGVVVEVDRAGATARGAPRDRRCYAPKRLPAAAGRLGVRVLDLEPGLHERVDVVERRCRRGRARSSRRRRRARRSPRPRSRSRASGRRRRAGTGGRSSRRPRPSCAGRASSSLPSGRGGA